MAEFNTEFANEYNTLANKLGIITCHFAEPCYNLVFYGILQTKKAPSKTRNIDYSASYMFLDPTITTPCHLLYFNSDLEMFPKIDPNGSVVVFNANIRVFNGKNQYYAQKSSPFALVDENSCDPKHRELVKMLCGWFNKTIIHQQPTSQSLKKDLRICDLHQDGSFFNFIGMIIHISTIESENGTQKLDLVVSDFTSNKKVKMAVGNVKLEYNLNSESVLLIHLWYFLDFIVFRRKLLFMYFIFQSYHFLTNNTGALKQTATI